MKKLLAACGAYCPAFMKRLWCQLALSYTVLVFCATTLLFAMLYSINDYNDFHKSVTPANIEQCVSSEKLAIAQVIHSKGNSEWWNEARGNLREKLTNLEFGNGNTSHRVTNSSIPEVYIQITDIAGNRLMSDPATLHEDIAAQFASRNKHPAARSGTSSWMEKNGHIWIDMPITGANDRLIGRVVVLYIAEFDFLVQLQNIGKLLLHIWNFLILLSVPIGIICGLVASRYVKHQLRTINEVTESWRRGNFDIRIVLPNDDIFIRHSQYLNDMAQDLESFLSLKKNIAVRDERTRLARELHDTVKQKLFALGLQLSAAKAKPGVMESAREHILEAETITREAQLDLMEIITQMRPSEDGGDSLQKRIDAIAEDYMRRFDVRIESKHSGSSSPDTNSDHQVLRIVQESLMNAVRHSKASKITVTSEVTNGITTLKISDNGCGFNVDRETKGFGIASMRERARELPQGLFEIESDANTGTIIRLSWRTASCPKK